MDVSARILTPYRNPPYRTPTPKSSVSPPPHTITESPKRKRADSEASSGNTLLRVNTSSRDFASTPGIESPRSKVAEKLRGLRIQTPEAQSGDVGTGARRKRVRRESGLLGRDGDGDEEYEGGSSSPLSRSLNPVEIGETPDCRVPRLPSTPSISPERIRSLDGLPLPQGVNSVDETAGDQNGERRKSPLQLTSPDISPSSKPCNPFIFTSPPSTSTASPPDQASLTWQIHEITGQDIDTSSPDDDGLGINGVGFRPTPAIAYARSMKRKQQVNEWRAREAREARQRRVERRRGASRGVGEERKGVGGRRVVRFEGEG
ncbi:PH and SEC7 domain-containing protein [Teratosphaeria destructans]|uniref:PH and SEC7 domain-containing protein n=1 Tax=Teratosphaeria destructans TaxID=418781 RepID=A0A9W7SKK0_9PEZI|nr:PH and SEC7 domain-containing protein [Teratosphaeria destructans]